MRITFNTYRTQIIPGFYSLANRLRALAARHRNC
jgi:hypothetical protein